MKGNYELFEFFVDLYSNLAAKAADYYRKTINSCNS